MIKNNNSFTKLPKNSVVCLMAPTASGKTALAYELYDTGKFEIISVDSALIYRDMDIGTAKPTKAELLKYPHHLVNIINPDETYSVASFVSDVDGLIGKIHAAGKIPLLVGGTMMYYMALFDGLSPVPETDVKVRQEVDAWLNKDGIEALHNYLFKVDPSIAKRLKPADTQRITRAVEVFKQTGKPLSYWQQLPKQALANNPNQHWLGIAVMPDRVWLHERMARRLEIMWAENFVDEVIELLTNYSLSPDMPAMRCVGYRQVFEYLRKTSHPVMKQYHDIEVKGFENIRNSELCDEAIACQDMKNKSLYATRQLAKRQYTWLRNLISSFAKAEKDDCIIENLSHNKQLSIESAITASKSESNKRVISFTTMLDAKQYLFKLL